MAEKNRVFFKSVEEAEAAGYKRAGNCPANVTQGTASTARSSSAASGASAASTPAATEQAAPAAASTSAQTTPATPAASATVAAGAIIGNKNSKIYHRPDCPGYKNVSEKNQAVFNSVAEAEAAGYRAAKNCPTPK
jgi:deoxyribonuclease-1